MLPEEKAVEDMTDEEIAQARAELAAERAALANGKMKAAIHTSTAALNGLAAAVDSGDSHLMDDVRPEDFEEELTNVGPKGPDYVATTVAPWPHEHLDFAGLMLEVRKPNESALIAISMTGVPGLDGKTQMAIFTRFLTKHLSITSFADVLEAMTDPDSGISIQGLISAMTQVK